VSIAARIVAECEAAVGLPVTGINLAMFRARIERIWGDVPLRFRETWTIDVSIDGDLLDVRTVRIYTPRSWLLLTEQDLTDALHWGDE
jgi:hypothetical protein